ncbi:unnamed protein product [Cylindrotheca closterium]|uniref:Uncharacterized protein n=1 Tax=Cylindrotheca closterium TaxID=2856 RepID=A0AAD2FGQ5_9STRA|nr:unnamed protein product [Cylindrotheca closterium]
MQFSVLTCFLLTTQVCSFHPTLSTWFSYRKVDNRRITLHSTEDDNGETATLVLDGGTAVSTGPLPFVSDEFLASFVQDTSNRNLLASAGGDRPLEEIQLTSDLLKTWQDACKELGLQKIPYETDSVIKVRTSGINFPGLQLESTASIGIMGDATNENQVYEFVLIQDENRVKGLPPIVWIFNKLTGSDGKGNGNNQSTSSRTTLVYKKISESAFFFTIKSRLVVNVKFPAFLLKILPTNKEKAEETGSKDVNLALKAFEKAYLEKAKNERAANISS